MTEDGKGLKNRKIVIIQIGELGSVTDYHSDISDVKFVEIPSCDGNQFRSYLYTRDLGKGMSGQGDECAPLPDPKSTTESCGVIFSALSTISRWSPPELA